LKFPDADMNFFNTDVVAKMRDAVSRHIGPVRLYVRVQTRVDAALSNRVPQPVFQQVRIAVGSMTSPASPAQATAFIIGLKPGTANGARVECAAIVGD
jgi:hypothetical protein